MVKAVADEVLSEPEFILQCGRRKRCRARQSAECTRQQLQVQARNTKLISGNAEMVDNGDRPFLEFQHRRRVDVRGGKTALLVRCTTHGEKIHDIFTSASC